MTKSELFIQKYKKVLETGPDFFARDAALMRPEEYKKRKYSFLLIAPSPALTKSVSATFAVINDMFCSEMDDWFFDIAYLPTKKDLDLYDKNNVPYCIGQISHLDASHFTMVGFSISVLHEVLTAPVIMKSWSRCDKPIPLSWTERKDTKFGEHPLILAGGITAAHGEVMFGELGDGRKSFLDFLVLGICDNLKMIGETLDKECTPEMTNQEVIESFFKHEFVYQPQAYRKVYKDNLIVENTKINPKARDFVKPYYPKFIPPRLGVGRTIIQPTGTNAGDTQIQLSEGALIKGSLVATQRGLVPIEEVTVEDSAWSLKGLHPVIQTWSLGVMQCVKLKTKGGVELTATLNHPVYQYDPINGESFVHAGKLQVGDCLVCIDYLILPEPSQVITDYLQEIVSVEYTEAEVYDLTVYGSHRYNANSVEVHNCTGGRGNCFFSVTGNMTIITDLGEMPISEAYVKQKEISKIRGEKMLEKFDRIARLGLEDVWFVRTSNNFALECSEHHKWVHMVDGEFVECETHELKTGMRVFTYTEADGYTPTKIRSVRKLNRKSVMYDVVNTETHLCVYNGILTHQCAESNYSGSWQEAPLAQIKRHALETKKWSAATSCKPLSFNALPDYTLIPTGGKFKRLSEITEDDKLINTRTDEASIVGIAIAQPKEHFRFRLDRGPAAVMSKDHRQVIATAEGLKTVQANEIKVGDYIPYLVGYYKDQDLEFSEKHFLAGLWYGDGYLSGRNKRAYQAVACHECELAKFVANSEFVDREVTTRDGIRHFLYTEEFGAFVKYLFPDYKYSDNNLTSLSVSEAVSFIRGWFNADGSVSYRSGCLDIQLTGSVKELQVLEWASTVLMSVGINNRVSAPVHVSLSGYDKIHVRYDLYVRTRASERLVLGWFVEPRKNSRVLTALRDDKRSSSDLIPPFVGKWMSKNYPRVSGANDYNFWSGLKAMSVERMEGKYASLSGGYLDMIRNGWRFAKVEEITDEGVLPCRDVLESDDHMYLTGFGLTHNCNHVEDFTEVIYALNEAFPKVTYINMRLEELAQDPEAFKMMRYTGASRLSAPIEGLSNRIRNGFMNKNLSQESIESLLRFLVGQRVTDIKVGLVWSGFENEDDWNEMRALVSKLKAEAASLNRKLPFRLKATPLVYYPGTPLEVAERVTSRISYEGKRYFNDEMYEKNKEAGIHIKINGFRGSTFIEQAIVDLGEQLTPWVYQHLVVPGTVCFNTRPVATDENFPSFKAIITAPDKYFAARKLDSYISPFHRIRLDLEGGIIEGQRRIETDPFNEHPTGKCLFTYEGCKTKCFHNVMKKRPYKHYYDVKLVDGKLVGDKYDLIEGCNSCESTEEMTTKHLRRKWAHKYSVDDLQAQVVTRTQKKYRLILKRLEEYSIVSPHSTAFTTMACLLRKSDKLLETYWNLVDHSLATQMSPDVVYDIKGYQIVDCIFKEEVIEELKKAIPLANQEMMTAQICGVYEIPLHEKLKTDDINVYKFEMDGGSLESFINCKASYNGGVRVLSSVDMQPKVVRQVDKELRYPLFKKKGNKVVGIFALPRKYNPYLFFQEVLSDKKYTQKQIQLCTTFEVVAVLQKDSFTHCSCGNNTVRSALTGKSMGRCEHCITKVLMSKL